jgi:hypothetical protein
LAEFFYDVYLTKDTSTPVTMHDIVLNGGAIDITSCGITPLTVGYTFNYLNLCGNRTIRNYMRGISPSFHIAPNPTTGSILVSSSQAVANVSISLVDVLGNELYRTGNFGPNSNFSFSLSDHIPSGIYYLVFRTDSFVTREQVVVVK